jgi:hypothetical protein
MRGGHERRQPADLRAVRIGSRAEQLVHHREAGVLAGTRERGHAMIVGGVDVGPGGEQPIDELEVVPVRGPQQSGGTVRACGVDVDTSVEQRLDGNPILLSHGLHETQIGLGRCRHRACCHHEGGRQSRAHESSFESRFVIIKQKSKAKAAVLAP